LNYVLSQFNYLKSRLNYVLSQFNYQNSQLLGATRAWCQTPVVVPDTRCGARHPFPLW
jgi:hypothetical protein